MAINPRLPEVPKVQAADFEGYLDEIFGTAHFSELPSFREFLRAHRGLRTDFFSKEAYEALALNAEMMLYQMFIQQCQMGAQVAKEQAVERAATGGGSLDDLLVEQTVLQAEADALAERLKLVQDRINERSKEAIHE